MFVDRAWGERGLRCSLARRARGRRSGLLCPCKVVQYIKVTCMRQLALLPYLGGNTMPKIKTVSGEIRRFEDRPHTHTKATDRQNEGGAKRGRARSRAGQFSGYWRVWLCHPVPPEKIKVCGLKGEVSPSIRVPCFSGVGSVPY